MQNTLLLKESFMLSCLWLVMALAVDCICFVLVKSPVSLTPHQFYIKYQPWISITYVLLFISPLLSYMLVSRRRLKTAQANNF